ncbi:MAG: hypothetical protein M3Y43_05705 [Pseudomonadota bacterium]|nr:hypothetical protein [Pseudomonadota bacterium]MDQ2704636.1 hypothetical protein [Pseudomonadota bacterium]
MWKLPWAAPLLFVAFAASADPVFVISDMNCSKVQATVQTNGSVVLRWQSRNGASLYGRYVSDRRFCRSGEVVKFASVPAADKSCNVKKCVWKIHGF